MVTAEVPIHHRQTARPPPGQLKDGVQGNTEPVRPRSPQENTKQEQGVCQQAADRWATPPSRNSRWKREDAPRAEPWTRTYNTIHTSNHTPAAKYGKYQREETTKNNEPAEPAAANSATCLPAAAIRRTSSRSLFTASRIPQSRHS